MNGKEAFPRFGEAAHEWAYMGEALPCYGAYLTSCVDILFYDDGKVLPPSYILTASGL